MATSSYKSYLMYKATSGSSTAYTKLIDIKDYPDLGGAPETLDTTTLSDNMKTSILGIQDLDALSFTANYDKADFTKVKALEGKEYDFAVWFGHDDSGKPDGSDGKFSFKGNLSVYVSGAGVNEVRDMTITIAPSTVISFE